MGAYRFCLACLVVLVHTPGYGSHSPDLGLVAVYVFFFISCYLMPLAFERNYQFTSFDQRWQSYLINRALRIYPLYWVSLAAILGHGLLRGTNPTVNEVLANPVSLLQNIVLLGLNQRSAWGDYTRLNIPAWTLDVELQYYLVVPLLIWGWTRSRRVAGAVIVTFGIVSGVLLAVPTSVVDIDRSLLAYAVLFLGGFLFYQFGDHLPAPSWRQAVAAVVVGGCGALLLPRPLQNAALTAGLIVVACPLLTRQARGVSSSVDRMLGELSYPVYIFHAFVITVATRLVSENLPLGLTGSPGLRVATLALINILLVSVLAGGVLLLLERPLQRVRRRFRHVARYSPYPPGVA